MPLLSLSRTVVPALYPYPYPYQERLREKSLQLVFACLSYDFIGTTLDEASEDVGTIQVDRHRYLRCVGSCVALPCCCFS